MTLRNWFLARFARVGLRRSRASDFVREVQSHLDLEAAEQQESGLSPQEARHAAHRAFGNATIISEDVRAVWTIHWWEGFLRDLRYGARSLRKNPGFTTVAVLTLALGIGANTAIFSAMNAFILQPLPFPAAGRIVRIFSTKGEAPASGYGNLIGPSPLDARDFGRLSHSFEELVAYDTWRKNVSFGNPASEPEQMRVGLVPATYFEILGLEPMMGRYFTAEENQPGKNFVAAISDRVWRNRYAGAPDILGRKIIINDEPYTIVAVMPIVIPEWMEPGRAGPVEVWTPFAPLEAWAESSRGGRGDAALALLKPGISLEAAQADLTAVAASLAATYPVDRGIGVALRPIADTRVGKLRPMLYLLMGAVSLILLIACVNLANLLLARNSARQRELAVRASLGAGRGGLIRQLLAETLLLSLLGASLGVALAEVALAGFGRLHLSDLTQLDSLAIDWRVLAFTLLVSLATSLLFGLAPALISARLNLVDALKQGGRSGTAVPHSRRMRSALVVTEVAMSLVLLVAAGLLVQSILRLDRQRLGILPDHLLKGHFYVPGARYPDAGAITRFCDAFALEVRSIPGVVNATVTTVYPPNNGWYQMIGLPGRAPTRIDDVPRAQFGLADAHFLRTLGIPLLRGRDFSEADNAASPPVALISEGFSRKYFPGENPVGRQIHIGPPPFLEIPPGAMINDSADVTVIGVVGDFRNAGLALPPEPQITVLYAQHPVVNYGFKDIVIRTAAEPRLLAPEIRRQLHRLDADMPFAEVQTMDELVDQQTGGQRLTATLLAAFAAAGLTVAAVGIYGVIAFLVVQRRQELALRLALGATPTSALWLVLRQGLGMAAAGAAIGLAGASAAQKMLSGLLFEISPLDPATFAAGAGFLLAIAAIASVVPSVSVMSLDPARTLRQD